MGKLERKYRDSLVVIGVQSPKYPAEAIPVNVEHAVQRLAVEHPVVVDAGMQVWDAYAVSAWPTLVFVSPSGQVIGQHAGEAPFEALDRALGQVIAQFDAEGAISTAPLDLGLRHFSRPPTELSFPGKVLATDQGLFIADTSHHRVIHSGLDGAVLAVLGDGRAGMTDGAFDQARFHRPQGLALDAGRSLLYIADEENHAIRVADLKAQVVRTMAGTGEQLMRLRRGGPAGETALSSPFDLALRGRQLLIAMAGTHQIWQLDLENATLGIYAGTGHEGIRDGTRSSAWLAQPMGLAQSDDALYVSCAETQAIRRLPSHADSVSTLVGRGLFDFGDRDGPVSQALLQHNQAVATADGVVYVADTYNNRLKRVAGGEVTVLAGSGTRGLLDGPGPEARFDEPAGLSLHRQTLYVADTNNHVIRLVDLESGHVRTQQLEGLY